MPSGNFLYNKYFVTKIKTDMVPYYVSNHAWMKNLVHLSNWSTNNFLIFSMMSDHPKIDLSMSDNAY